MADGKSVVYPVRVNGVDNVWLKPLDGSPGRQLTEFSTGQITVVRPSHNAPMSHNRGGFLGAYVCERCLGSCDGVYLAREEQRWLCGACKTVVTTKQEQPAGLTRQIVWGDRAKHFPGVLFSCTVQSAEPSHKCSYWKYLRLESDLLTLPLAAVVG